MVVVVVVVVVVEGGTVLLLVVVVGAVVVDVVVDGGAVVVLDEVVGLVVAGEPGSASSASVVLVPAASPLEHAAATSARQTSKVLVRVRRFLAMGAIVPAVSMYGSTSPCGVSRRLGG